MAYQDHLGYWVEHDADYTPYQQVNWQYTTYSPYPLYPTYYSDNMLAPDRYYDGRRRSRSTGGRPLPNINVVQNTGYDYDSPPRSRSRHRYRDEELVDAVDDVAREIRHNRGRSPSPYMMQQQMQMELARERERSRWELERERERLEYELEHDRQEARQRAETEAQLARTRAEIRALKMRLEEDEREGRVGGGGKVKKDWELERLKEEARRRAEEQRRKDERDKIHTEDERDEQREKDRQEAAIAAYKKKQDKEKREREDMLATLKREEEEKAQKEKDVKEMWRQKLEKEKKEEEEKKKKREQEIEDELARRLHKVGFQQNQVDAILDPKKKARPGAVPGNALVISKPTYIRIHRDHIDIETLRYFNLPWEYDQGDAQYVVILQEIDKHETDILFEHTRKLRKGATTLLIEDRGRNKHGGPQYAFVKRRPSASPSRRKTSPKRVNVNFGLFG